MFFIGLKIEDYRSIGVESIVALMKVALIAL